MNNGIDWSVCRKVLCVRPDNIGDVLMTTPALRAIKSCHPGLHLTLLASSAGRRLAKLIPEVDDAIRFDPPWYKHEAPACHGELESMIKRLAAERFDAALIFTVFSQNPLPNAMLCQLAGIPVVAGYCRENPYSLLSHWVPDEEPLYGMQHEVRRQLSLVAALGIEEAMAETSLSLDVDDDAAASIRLRLQRLGLDAEQPWLMMHPGASEKKRRYPAAHFAEAARRLHEQTGFTIILTGDRQEQVLAESIVATAGPGVVSLAGELQLEELIALVDLAPLVISNNTGPVHIAAARNTPVVVLYAMTNPQHLPWQVPCHVLPFDVPRELRTRNVVVRYGCEQAFSAPAGMVQPEEIVAAAIELLNARSSDADTDLLRTPVVTDVRIAAHARHGAGPVQR